MVWEAVFLLLVLKIPIVYLCLVVWWAIKAVPLPEEGAGLVARVEPTDPSPCEWRRRVARRPVAVRARSAARAVRRRRPRSHAQVNGRERDLRAPNVHSDLVGGLLAAASIFAGAVGVVQTPIKVIPISIVLALVSVRMTDRYRVLATWAVGLNILWWLLGMTVAVLTDNALY